MNINNVPSTGGNYTVSYSFEDGVSRAVTASTNDNWITVSVDSSNIYIVISDNNESQRTGNVSVSVDNEVCSSKGIVIKQDGTSPTPTGDFASLIDEFNRVGIVEITTAHTETWSYLESMYDAAVAEWDNNKNNLFSKDNFDDVYDFHSSENTGTSVSFSGVTSWVIASCLSELFPSSGSQNNQTRFFKKAYDLGGGSSKGIYTTDSEWGSGYTMKDDPIMSRLIASEIYAHERGKYSLDDINGFRGEFQNVSYSLPSATDWDGLEYVNPTNPGYIIESSLIIPCSPGPYSVYADPGHPYPWDGSGQNKQPSDLFYYPDSSIPDHYTSGSFTFADDTTTIDWYCKNYKRDAEIDSYIVKNYNLGSWTHGKSCAFENNTDNNKKELLLHASIMPDESIRYFFGNKNLVFCGTTETYIDGGETKYYIDDLCNGYTKYVFAEQGKEIPVTVGTMSDTGDTTVYEINGPFGDLEQYMFNGSQNTSAMNYLDRVRQIGNRARYATNKVDEDIRRRPLGDYEQEQHQVCPSGEITSVWYGRKDDATCNGHPLDGISNGTAQAIYATNSDEEISLFNGDCFPRDGPNSYISGHASQTWMVGLMLAQMFSASDGNGYANAIKYLNGAYRVGVGRNISRYHWNSDTLYGRLNACMNFPIVNAMVNNNYDYECTKSTVTGGGGCGEAGGIWVRVVNNSGYKIGFNKIKLYCISDESVYGYYDDKGEYVDDFLPHCGNIEYLDEHGQAVAFDTICLENGGTSDSIFLRTDGCRGYLGGTKIYFAPVNRDHRAVCIYDFDEQNSDNIEVDPLSRFNESNPTDSSRWIEVVDNTTYDLRVTSIRKNPDTGLPKEYDC